MTESITSRDNERVKRVCKLRDCAAARQQEQLFFAEGLRLCTDLAAMLTPQEVYFTQKLLDAHPELEQLGGRHFLVSDGVAAKLSDTKAPQGVFCVFPRSVKTVQDIRAGGRYVCMEHVQDPANVGALLRSAAAFGFTGAVLCADCADPFSPKASRASMGALAKVDLIVEKDTAAALRAFSENGIPSFAAALRNSVPLETVDTAGLHGAAVIIGNEGNGLTDETTAAADRAVRIPMAPGVESLNAAVAGSVLLWHFRGV